MKQGLTVIMTIRGSEPQANQTVENVRLNAGCPVDMITVYDGQMNDENVSADQVLVHKTPRGIGRSRHRGILAARYAVVLLIDAHMNFQKNFGKKILEHYRLKRNAKDITCGRCVPSMANLEPSQTCPVPECGTSFASDMTGKTVTCPNCGATFPLSRGYTGARFTLKSEETGGEKWCLSGKWADQKVNAEIGCVFGACYSFRKKWYEELGAPLDLLQGWFGDEEYLSISSWLAGGRCFLLDYWASHLFRDRPSFVWGRNDWMFPAVNRARLIELFSCDKEMKLDLQAWNELSLRSADACFMDFRQKDARRKEVKAAKKLWRSWAKNVPDFLSRWVDNDAKPLEERLIMRDKARPWKNTTVATLPPAPRVQQRKYIVCANCNQRNTFRVSRTVKTAGVRRRYGKCNNKNCQIAGVLVDRPDGQVMYWGKDSARL